MLAGDGREPAVPLWSKEFDALYYRCSDNSRHERRDGLCVRTQVMFRRGPLGKPPGPIGSPITGVYRQFRKSPAEYLLSLSREYGDLSYFRVGFQRMYLLNQPDFIEEVLVTSQANFTKSRILQRAKVFIGNGLLTSEGDFHIRQRKMIQPAFYRDRLTRYASDMVMCADAAQSKWKSGETRDIADEMMRLTLSIVGRTLFTRDVSEEASDVGKALTAVVSTYGTLLAPFSNLIRRLPLPSIRRAKSGQRYLDKTIYRIIDERRRSGEDHGDLLSMLILASDDNDRGMTDKQVRDEALTLFLAGHETTAAALTWTIYLLSQHPDVESKLQEELSRRPGREDARLRRSRPAHVHGDGACGIDAAIPTGLGDRPDGKTAIPPVQLRIDPGFDLPHESVCHAPASEVLSGSGAI